MSQQEGTEGHDPASGEVPAPTMLGFVWTPRTITLAMRQLSGELWCVRDAYTALLRWAPGSDEWQRFIEAPDGPSDMERLIHHLGLVSYDPEYQPHAQQLQHALDHPGIACYKLHAVRQALPVPAAPASPAPVASSILPYRPQP